MHHDAVNAFGRLKPHCLPSFAAVKAAKQAAADGLGVARISFAGAHPNHVGVAGVDADGTNGRIGLLVPNGGPGLASIGAFPESARGRSCINHAFVARIYIDGGDPSAHAGGADATEFQVFKYVFRKGLGRQMKCGQESEGEKAKFH